MASSGKQDAKLLKMEVGGVVITHGVNVSTSYSTDERETTTKDSASSNKEFEPGMKSGTLSFEAIFAEDATYAFGDLFTLWNAGTKSTILVGSAVSGDLEYSQSAFITSLDMTAGNQGENQTYSVTMRVTGAVTEAAQS